MEYRKNKTENRIWEKIKVKKKVFFYWSSFNYILKYTSYIKSVDKIYFLNLR